MQGLLTAEGLLSLLTLTILEIVLGIDNVIFVSIIMGRMPKEDHKKARLYWMLGGIVVRVALLASLSFLLKHGTTELFAIAGKGFNLKGLIMLGGGLFLLVKTIGEIHSKLEGEAHEIDGAKKGGSFWKLMVNILLVDMVFSFDSIITAVGIADHLEVMVIAVIIAMIGMFLFSGKIAEFIDKHPTIKMLALSFLIMVAMVLVVEGWMPEKAEEMHLKNFVYFAMAFSFCVELLNMRMQKKSKKPVQLNEKDLDDSMKNDLM